MLLYTVNACFRAVLNISFYSTHFFLSKLLTLLLYCAIRVRVSYIIMCIVLSSCPVVLLHFVTILTNCYTLSIDKDSRQGHNGNYGKAIKPDHPAR